MAGPKARAGDPSVSARKSLPIDRDLLRRLSREADQRIRFYQSFLTEEVDGQSRWSFDVGSIERIRRLVKAAGNPANDLITPGFEVMHQTYMQPRKSTARSGRHGMVEDYLSYNEEVERVSALEVIKDARNRLEACADGIEFGITIPFNDALQRALDERNNGLHRLVHLYEGFAEKVEAKLNAPTKRPDGDEPRQRVPRRKKNAAAETSTENMITNALCIHHKYEDGRCDNREPATLAELVEILDAKVSRPTLSRYLQKKFRRDDDSVGGHKRYQFVCNSDRIGLALKVFRGELPLPEWLYGSEPTMKKSGGRKGKRESDDR